MRGLGALVGCVRTPVLASLSPHADFHGGATDGNSEQCWSQDKIKEQGLEGHRHPQDEEWRQKHSHVVESLILRLLEAGTLRALQVVAVHSSLAIDIRRLATSGLQHLALACKRLRLDHTDGTSSSPPVPSIHLFTWVRTPGSNLGANTCSLTTDSTLTS